MSGPPPRMFEATVEAVDRGVARYVLSRTGETLSFAAFLELLASSGVFVRYFSDLLAGAPFQALRWECPAVNRATVNRDFEFVLLDSPWLDVPADSDPFLDFFIESTDDAGVVSFENLGGDALLVAPSPRAAPAVYPHLAAFLRGAPEFQRQALWSEVGRAVRRRLSHRPLWLSTAGGGVAWLHVRLDSRPKYYGYAPYRTVHQ